MIDYSASKILLHKEVERILEEKIQTLHELIASAKESRDSDTKSSVGDKYETSRAMLHIEIGKNEVQLNNTLKLKNELSRINAEKHSEVVGFGSVVITNSGKYYISVAVGKLNIDTESFYSISLASPIGKVLNGISVGDKVMFQNKEIEVLEVY